MSRASFDFKSRWARAATLMKKGSIDAIFLMKPANLPYLTGDGRPCALGLLTRPGAASWPCRLRISGAFA